MQSKEKNLIDTRTFPQIWASLSPVEQMGLNAIIQDKLGVSRKSVYNWAQGNTKPYIYIRKSLSNVLKQALGIYTSHQTLFA
jgi:hypothetical protein